MAAELHAEVAVVGAGVAGLVAARRALEGGVSTLVLEARDRVGGRTLNGTVAGSPVELGGQWVGPTQQRVLALIAELRLETFPTHVEGHNVIEWRGRIRRYRGTVPRGLGPGALLGVERARRRLARSARRIDPAGPSAAPGSAGLDALSFGAWLHRVTRSSGARQLMTIATRVTWGADPDELGLLGVLAVIRSAGGFDALLDVEGGAQQDRIVGGSQRIALRLAAELGERVVVEAPVTRIAQDENGVMLVAGGHELRARRAIVTVPPPLIARIEFSPPLPLVRRQLVECMPGGSMWKLVAAYPDSFWRADGLSGEGLSDRGPVTVTFDNSPPEGSPGMLVGFVGGRDARAFSTLAAPDRRAAALDCFARLFGPAAAEPIDYVEQDWESERWSRGGPVFMPSPGALTAHGPALHRPCGLLHWAGAETSPVWCGYLDGAVRSGERAAAEALDALVSARQASSPAPSA